MRGKTAGFLSLGTDTAPYVSEARPAAVAA
jgi:hypothetical protein